ncbi:MAG: uncharacterized protein QOG78_2194 [Rhodospirillaceae bacterium]|nr:uncharacterized protein [Rhodospirillaceae bacterium]
MSLGMYAASVPVYQRQLGAISKVLEKGSAWAAAKKVDEAVLGATRLIPDMLPLTRQVQLACRFAEESPARLAGIEAPKAPENAEKTLTELRGRIDAVLAHLKGFKPEQVDGSEGREIVLNIGGNPLKLTGQQYLLHFAMANFYFHCTTTHAILRHSGVDVGKRDFLGGI